MIIDRNVESRHVRGRRRLPIFFASRSRGPLLENRTRPAPSRPLLRRTIRGGEFSRRKVPNVVADSSRYLVQWLKLVCPRLGKVKIAQILCRAGLHLGPTTVGRMIKEPPPKFPQASKTAAGGRVVTAKRPDQVWHVDLTAVPTFAGFWVSWSPFAVFPRWPFGWWVAVVLDHSSCRVRRDQLG